MRIAVVGSPGSGKSTLARQIARQLALDHIELDTLFWGPRWRPLGHEDPAAFRMQVEAATSTQSWICDGGYSDVRDLVWARADTLVWLDYSRALIMSRVIRRSVWRASTKARLFSGNVESWPRLLAREHPIRWAWDTWADRRLQFAEALATPDFAHLAVYRLNRPHQANALVERLRKG